MKTVARARSSSPARRRRADAGQDGRFQGGAQAGAALPGRRRRDGVRALAALAGGQSEGTGLSLGIDDPREGTVLWVIGGFFFATYANWAKEQPDSDSHFFAEYDERRLHCQQQPLRYGTVGA